MSKVDQIRAACFEEGRSISEISRLFDADRRTVRKYILMDDFNDQSAIARKARAADRSECGSDWLLRVADEIIAQAILRLFFEKGPAITDAHICNTGTIFWVALPFINTVYPVIDRKYLAFALIYTTRMCCIQFVQKEAGPADSMNG